jgi:tRNA threonylcarbamoyl adenosine modification protein YeaZ
MNWLLIDTSCPRAVVALSVDGKSASVRYLLETKKHSELLAPAVKEVLSEAKIEMKDLNGIAVGKGPGSFIGSRIAMAFAKGVCVALDIPLVGLGTLSAIGHEPGLPVGEGVAVIDARRGEYYIQSTGSNEPRLFPADQLSDVASTNAFVVGTSIGHLTAPNIFSVEGPSAEGMLAAFLELPAIIDEKETLVPEYVRDPDAKPMTTPLKS